MRLLAVEGNNSLPDSHLCDDQNVVVRAATPEEALSILRHDTVDVVVIDVASLADRGFGFIRQVRAARDDTPIVALTGQQAADRIRALGLGADDAITQPVDPPELRARIAAVVRRSQGLSQSVAVAGDLSLFLSAREVLYGGVPVHLTAKEYAVLELLVVRKGQIITKEMFLDHIYGGADEPDGKIVDVFICKLRRRLSSAGAPDMIATVWGRGYSLRKSVEQTKAPLTTTVAGKAPVRPDFRPDHGS